MMCLVQGNGSSRSQIMLKHDQTWSLGRCHLEKSSSSYWRSLVHCSAVDWPLHKSLRCISRGTVSNWTTVAWLTENLKFLKNWVSTLMRLDVRLTGRKILINRDDRIEACLMTWSVRWLFLRTRKILYHLWTLMTTYSPRFSKPLSIFHFTTTS